MIAPWLLSALGWLAIGGAVYAAVDADQTASVLTMAIACMFAIVAVLLQTLAISVSLGRRFDAVLAAVREAAVPANDRGR